MSTSSEHSGVSVGGSVNAGGDVVLGHHIAVGEGASVTVPSPSGGAAEVVAARLEQLLRVLAEQSASLEDRPAVFRSAAEVEEALAARPPSRRRITTALAALARGVRSVASIANAVDLLDSAVGDWL